MLADDLRHQLPPAAVRQHDTIANSRGATIRFHITNLNLAQYLNETGTCSIRAANR
jgi:hypothetical protein